ncbi:MAG: hypothetical protein ABIO16_14135, partial [Nocardioides sp.]
DARHTEPMPADVAARMERLLEGLASERAPVAPVIDLARRRRTAAKLLVAAAAVVVAGVGIGQVLPHLGGTSNDSPTSAQGEAAPQADAGGDGGGSSALKSQDDTSSPEAGYAANAVKIHGATFGADVRRIRAAIGRDSRHLTSAPGPTCLAPGVGEGIVLAATYDDAAAALVLRTPVGDSQVVDLYLCGQDQPQRSITLPVP